MPAMSDAARRKNNDAHKALYQWYKSRGICPHCRKAYAEGGRVYCAQCANKINVRANKERKRMQSAERRARLKAAGMCVDCAKSPAVEGKTRCKRCEQRMRESRERWNILQKIQRQADQAREAGKC